MPRTSSTRSAASAAATPANREVLSLAEAAAYLRADETDVLQLIREQALPARRIGEEWRLLKAAVQAWLACNTPADSSKAAQLAVAGSWRHDPLVDEELRQIYQRRRAATVGDGP